MELVVATAVFLAFWGANVRTLLGDVGRLPRAVMVRSGIGVAVIAAGLVGEVATALGTDWGLTLTALGFLTVLPLLVFNAWALLIGIVEVEPAPITVVVEPEQEPVAGRL